MLCMVYKMQTQAHDTAEAPSWQGWAAGVPRIFYFLLPIRHLNWLALQAGPGP